MMPESVIIWLVGFWCGIVTSIVIDVIVTNRTIKRLEREQEENNRCNPCQHS